jgi:hypothetical protein
MKGRRGLIPPRIPVFVGCEGDSERGYATLLGRLLFEDAQLAIHIQADLLTPGGGDPLFLVERAIRQIVWLERTKQPFRAKAILLDRDLIGRVPVRDQQAFRLAETNGIQLIWQRPDYEGFILRHLPQCGALRPPSGRSMEVLQGNWPQYRKGLSAVQLAERIDLAGIRQAA